MNSIKQSLYNLCFNYIEERIQTAQNAIEAARESANDDTKSSAGDKYETGREMMQQEINTNAKQLNETLKLKILLQSIDPENSGSIIRNGSLVFTNHETFYIAISAGKQKVNGKNYFVISASSPIGTLLIKCKQGDSFNFNGKEFTVIDIK